MKVAFGALVMEFSGLGELHDLAAFFDDHAAPAEVSAQAPVEIRIDPRAGLGEHAGRRTDAAYDAASDNLLFSSVCWEAVAPAHGAGAITLTIDEWAEDKFDHAMRSMVQFLAPLRADSVILHSSSVARGCEGFAFPAHSSTGKTTVARLSQQLGYTVLAEELTCVGFVDGVATLFNLPVIESNHLNLGPARAVPLVGLYRLVQHERDAVEPIEPQRRFLEIASIAAIGMRFPVVMNAVLDVVQRLIAAVEPRYLRFANSPAFWQAIDADLRQRRVASEHRVTSEHRVASASPGA